MRKTPSSGVCMLERVRLWFSKFHIFYGRKNLFQQWRFQFFKKMTQSSTELNLFYFFCGSFMTLFHTYTQRFNKYSMMVYFSASFSIWQGVLYIMSKQHLKSAQYHCGPGAIFNAICNHLLGALHMCYPVWCSRCVII